MSSRSGFGGRRGTAFGQMAMQPTASNDATWLRALESMPRRKHGDRKTRPSLTGGARPLRMRLEIDVRVQQTGDDVSRRSVALLLLSWLSATDPYERVRRRTGRAALKC